jgi:hypothetical protein
LNLDAEVIDGRILESQDCDVEIRGRLGLKTFWQTQDPYAIGSENKLDGDPDFFHRQTISLYVGGNVLDGYSYTG